MAYNIRNEKSTLIATIDNDIARKMINSVPGFFRNTKDKSGLEKTVFEVTDNMKFALHGFEFFLWKGYVLVPN
jgi:hypothetical protein